MFFGILTILIFGEICYSQITVPMCGWKSFHSTSLSIKESYKSCFSFQSQRYLKGNKIYTRNISVWIYIGSCMEQLRVMSWSFLLQPVTVHNDLNSHQSMVLTFMVYEFPYEPSDNSSTCINTLIQRFLESEHLSELSKICDRELKCSLS